MSSVSEYISLNEAAEISGKSLQTIRRAVKAKKISIKRKKTPQGFHYLVEKKSLMSCYAIKTTKKMKNAKAESVQEAQQIPFEGMDIGESIAHMKEVKKNLKKDLKNSITPQQLKEFEKALHRFVQQHQKEREQFVHLIQAFQKRVSELENQIKLLDAPGKKRWYHFWK